VILDNRARKYDASNTAGAYYGKLLPRRRIRVTLGAGAVTAAVFTGYTLGYQLEYPKFGDAVCHVQCTDAFDLLASGSYPGSAYGAEVLADSPTYYWPMQSVGTLPTADVTATVGGVNLQARYAVKNYSNNNAVSLRPYLNAAAGPNGNIGSAGGALVSYDWSIAKAASGVSKANVYAGAGYQIPFVNNSQANYQSAIGSRGQAVLALGTEARLTNSLIGFAQLTFPTTNAGSSYGNTKGTYSPVFATGLGFKF
jgi:hypothetical protein